MAKRGLGSPNMSAADKRRIQSAGGKASRGSRRATARTAASASTTTRTRRR